MQLIRGIDQLGSQCHPSVVSIGNYDGVHLGHQAVIANLLHHAERTGATPTVVTFEPLAKEFFKPQSLARLSSNEERAELLFNLGIKRVVAIDFTAQFAAYSPQGFVDDVLLDGLGVKHVSVGDDFRFGKDRAGDFDFLLKAGAQHGFAVTAHDTLELAGQRVSSERVRHALATGDCQLAAQLLNRVYSISGEVVMGQQLGRTLDFPTANIALPDRQLAVRGVFAVVTQLESGERVNGVANIGFRPTLDGTEQRLEAHFFDFDRDIYGQKIIVELHHKIRDEKKFASLADLQAQINQDAAAAQAFF